MGGHCSSLNSLVMSKSPASGIRPYYIELLDDINVYSKTRSVSVEVPAGVESGIGMYMPGEGADGEPGAPRGDLYVSLRVQADPYFERSGADIHVVATTGFAQVR